MTRFLFWNVNRKLLGHRVAQIAHEQDIDVILLAECLDVDHILEELNQTTRRLYTWHLNPIPSKIELFSRFPLDSVAALGDFSGLSFRRLKPPAGMEILLVGVHLPSKFLKPEPEQKFDSIYYSRQIRDYEELVGHQRTVVVGDFNMNPFEEGLIAAHGFHALSSRRFVQRGTRQVRGESYPFFYNPMWSHFGDRDDEPPGTYFYDAATAVNVFWHMFDQVLVRPDLLSIFPVDRVRIIASAGGQSLLSPNGRPNGAEISDHLPISFVLNLMEDANDL